LQDVTVLPIFNVNIQGLEFFLKVYFKIIFKRISLQSQNRGYHKVIRPVRLGVRTLDFHSRNRGSIPLRATKN
jgi:hypothetical protein